MGIRQLNKIINKYAPDAVQESDIHTLKNKIIGVDSSILLYRYRYVDKDSKDSHIHGFIQRVCFYLKNGITPVFVFDGIPPVAKKHILANRVTQKNKVEDKIQILVDKKSDDNHTPIEIDHIDNEINKLKKQVIYVTKSHRQECKYLLKLMGIPVIEATGEAESTCACLQKRGITHYTYTEDTDVLTFGAPIMIRTARKLNKVIQINLQTILKSLNLNMDEFIDLCILCGCDYCTTIPKVGPITALNLIQKHSCIENIIDLYKDKYTIPQDFDYKTARKLFTQKPTGDDPYDVGIGKLQVDKLREFILCEMKMSNSTYQSIINKINKSLTEYNKINSQTPITNFFKPRCN